MKRALCVLLAVLFAFAAAAQDPDNARGSKPGLAYRLDGLDQTSLFNGTLTLNIPLGQTYPVGGTLEYGLTASYATNSWKTETIERETSPNVFRTYTYGVPVPYMNAGFGWLVSLGAIIDSENATMGKVYLAPDGSEHEFHWTLHSGHATEPSGQTSYMYTRDGTYIRMHRYTGGWTLYFPNGHTHYFDASGRLTSMIDQFGNNVTVSYGTQSASDPYPGSTVWTISDSTGRSHKVYFRPDWSYQALPWQQPIQREIVHKVVLAAYDDPNVSGDGKAEYTFNYMAAPEPGGSTAGLETARRCLRNHDPDSAQYVVASLLNEIVMPEGVTYGMRYDRGEPDRTVCSSTPLGGASGNIKRLLLPSGANIDNTDATGGHIDWTYQKYNFPGSPGFVQGANNNAGVLSRKAKNGSTVLNETVYELGTVTRSTTTTPDLSRRVTTKDGAGTPLSTVIHYFTACRQSFCGNGGEYGLSLTRAFALGDAYLSNEIQRVNTDGSYATLRKTWVRYEGDSRLTGGYFETNQRRNYERTDFEDGTYADTTFTNFDGMGHFRQTLTGGNLEKGNVRTTFQNWNPTLGEYKLDANGNALPGYNMPSFTATWLFTTFTKIWKEENGVKSASEFCFDSTGFMTSNRTFTSFGESPTRSTSDFLVLFTRDATTGNLTKQQYFGGEVGSPAPTSHTCGAALTGETYRTDHYWTSGVRTRSANIKADGTAMSTDVVNTTVDANTGMTTKSRSFSSAVANATDGVITTHKFDALGRPKQISTPTQRTEYSYQLLPPKVTTSVYDNVSQNLLRTSTEEYDVIGRLVKQTRSTPAGTATTETRYNALGLQTEVFDWGATAATQYSYDEFGRPTMILPPGESEDNATLFAYTGVASVTRTNKVRTAGDQSVTVLSSALTTEDFDRQGRLIRVTEPSVGGVRPVTEYTYDVNNNTTLVCSNKVGGVCNQTRSFSYDNRGLLTSETTPEVGTTTYPAYDARGYLRRRYVNSATGAFHLGFTFDRAERLTSVWESDQFGNEVRKLKFFTFAENNTGSEVRNGQLSEAIRFNWVNTGGINFGVQIVENYTYNSDGRVSARKTENYICQVSPTETCRAIKAGSKYYEFNQTFTYDALGATTTLGYPQCAHANCTGLIPSRTITNGYTNGYLTSVTWSGAVWPNTIEYHTSGLVKKVTHDNFVVDEQTVDPAVPSRPLSLITTNALDPSTCVSPTFTTQPQSQTKTLNQSFTLTALAQGETGQSITYQWYLGIAPNRNNPIGGPIVSTNGTTLQQTMTGTASYWVEASNSCSSAPGGTKAVSSTATVTLCTPSSISTAPTSRTITRTNSTTLTAAGAGSQPLRYQWYTMSGTIKNIINGATDPELTVSPNFTTRYRIYVTNDCNSTGAWAEATVTVVNPPTAPTVTAQYESANGRNLVSWTQASSGVGISQYVIERSDGYSQTVSGSTLSWPDYNIVAGRTYVYTVHAIDVNDVDGTTSSPDLTTTFVFTDDPLRAPTDNGGHWIRGLHISQLRQAVDMVRTAAGLSPGWSSPYNPPTGLAYAVHVTEILSRLNEARQLLGVPQITLTDTVAPGQVIYRNAINQLRTGTK